MQQETCYTIARFRGIREQAGFLPGPGDGEASTMENFALTDAGQLRLRPGLRPLLEELTPESSILGFWAGYAFGGEYLVLAVRQGTQCRLILHSATQTTQTLDPFPGSAPRRVLFLPYDGGLYALTDQAYLRLEFTNGTLKSHAVTGYVPLVLTNASPSGAGDPGESINMLNDRRRIWYSSNGSSVSYRLPSEAVEVLSVTVNGLASEFTFRSGSLLFSTPPQEGINNVEVCYRSGTSLLRRLAGMPYTELFSGPTHTHILLYGDGSNQILYSGVTRNGVASAEYFPFDCELQVGAGNSPITGLIRHYSSLLAFQADGAWVINAGSLPADNGGPDFSIRPLRAELGNEMPGQVKLVDNCPRTFSHGVLYDWTLPTGYYRNERYTKPCGEAVQVSLRELNPNMAVAFDDDSLQTYYLFPGDGRALVHRYRQDSWYLYRSDALTDLLGAVRFGKEMILIRTNDVLCWDWNTAYDQWGGASAPIQARWVSGDLEFGKPTQKKYIRHIWLQLLPEPDSHLTVAAVISGQGQCGCKSTGAPTASYRAVHYGKWCYTWGRQIRTRRIHLPIRRFGSCRLEFRVTKPGARATILGCSLKVRDAGELR